MLATRSDLAYAGATLSRFGTAPSKEHWTALKRVIRYVASTAKAKLELGARAPGPETGLVGFTDSAFADDVSTWRSTCGYVFTLGSGAISWTSKRRPLVALSTTEAEYNTLQQHLHVAKQSGFGISSQILAAQPWNQLNSLATTLVPLLSLQIQSITLAPNTLICAITSSENASNPEPSTFVTCQLDRCRPTLSPNLSCMTKHIALHWKLDSTSPLLGRNHCRTQVSWESWWRWRLGWRQTESNWYMFLSEQRFSPAEAGFPLLCLYCGGSECLSASVILSKHQ